MPNFTRWGLITHSTRTTMERLHKPSISILSHSIEAAKLCIVTRATNHHKSILKVLTWFERKQVKALLLWAMSFKIYNNGIEHNVIIPKPFLVFLKNSVFFWLKDVRKAKFHEVSEPSLKRCAEICVKEKFHDPSRDSLVSYSSEFGIVLMLRNRHFMSALN